MSPRSGHVGPEADRPQRLDYALSRMIGFASSSLAPLNDDYGAPVVNGPNRSSSAMANATLPTA
jgi:hypothetical protein